MKIPLANLRGFEAVARLLSFTLAAKELNLSQSAVSQQIGQLEERLGFKLFRRLTRRLELTENGRRLYETVRRAVQDIDGIVAALQDREEEGTVTLSVGSSFASNWLIPRLGGFSTACPKIDLRIKPADVLVDLQTDPSIDISVRFAQRGSRALVARKLAREKVFVVCSPALLEKRKPPGSLADLAAFTLLHNEVSDQESGAAGDWANWLAELRQTRKREARKRLDLRSGPRLPRSDLLVQAAVHGHGAALVWTTMVRNELRDGRLVKLFGGRFETANSYYASCTSEAFAKPKVRAVVNWLTAESHRPES